MSKMMTKRFYSETDLGAMRDANGMMQSVAYTMRAPQPQMFLVTMDSQIVNVRTVTLTPLTWIPYTKAISIPLDDTEFVRALSDLNAQCVLSLPSRELLRQLTICAQRLPRGISEAQLARFKLHKSLSVDVPSIEDCPVNFECVVEHTETYCAHWVVFLRVVGASIDDAMLFRERKEIASFYPTNFADEIVDEHGRVKQRVSLMGDLFLCPTFPVAPKQGWYGTFDLWMKDLFDEEYLNREEYDQAIGWFTRWQGLFADLNSPERAQIRIHLSDLIRIVAHERWAEMHAFLAETRG